ncbi:MAG: hypothetical protein GX657_04125 [Chloroflexi bacterium]|nr:hypothetical protein [Chloroflexota bacterium]
MRSLEPHLREIERAGGLSEEGLAGFRGAFGDEAGRFEGYVQAYGGLVVAARVAAEAQVAYDAAVEEGDEEAIRAAETQLETAREQEQAAQRRVAAEQARIAQSMTAEARLARAVEERSRQEEAAAGRAAQREAEAEARRAEAEAKRVADARLRWELAVAETPERQLAIWQRELAATEEGSAEYYDTLTRIVQLEQRIRDERARGGAGAADWGAGIGDELAGAEEELRKAGGGLDRGIDWGGIGLAIGQKLLDKIVEKLTEWPARILAWAQTGDATTALFEAGTFLADVVLSGLRGIFGGDAAVAGTQASMETHLKQAAYNAGAAAIEIGGKLAEGVIARFAAELTGEGTPDETMAAWQASRQDWRAPVAGVMTKLFGNPVDAAIVAQALMDVANDEEVAAGVRAAAKAQAEQYIQEYGLKVHGELGVMTEEAFRAQALQDGIIGAAAEAGAAAGTAMGNAISDAAEEAFKANPPELEYIYPDPPPGYDSQKPKRGGIPGYASGGLVTKPTLAWIGEEGPELVIPLPQGIPAASSLPPVGRGGDTYVTVHIDARGANAGEVKRGVLAGLRAAGVTP